MTGTGAARRSQPSANVGTSAARNDRRMIKRIIIAAPVALIVIGVAAAEAFAGNTNQHAQLLGRPPR